MSIRPKISLFAMVLLVLLAGCGRDQQLMPSATPGPALGTLSAMAHTAAAPTPSPALEVTLPPASTQDEPTPGVEGLTQENETQAPQPDGGLRITILYDNYLFDPRLESAWGFAALVAYQDHTGGLASLLAEAAHPTVYLLASFPGSFKRSAAALTSVVEVSHPVEIFPDVYSTGEVDGGIKEQALAIRTESGVVIITGCAHPGVARMVRRGIKASVPGDGLDETPVALVVGGFHLLDQSPGQIEALIADFESLHVRRVCPTHCTGDRAIAMFAKAFGEGYIPGGAGQVITLP